MARLIQEFIKRPLAEELLFGKLVGGGSVTVSVSEDGTKLKLESTPNQLPEVTA
jgi:ATP-dependent Clp protease ATP-binding subunit ClpA